MTFAFPKAAVGRGGESLLLILFGALCVGPDSGASRVLGDTSWHQTICILVPFCRAHSHGNNTEGFNLHVTLVVIATTEKWDWRSCDLGSQHFWYFPHSLSQSAVRCMEGGTLRLKQLHNKTHVTIRECDSRSYRCSTNCSIWCQLTDGQMCSTGWSL